MRHRALSQRALTKNTTYQQNDSDVARTFKTPLFLLEDMVGKQERRPCNETIIDTSRLKQSSGEVPLYICPPPPPMDERSPTEETRLLYHSSIAMPTAKQARNSIPKGIAPSS